MKQFLITLAMILVSLVYNAISIAFGLLFLFGFIGLVHMIGPFILNNI